MLATLSARKLIARERIDEHFKILFQRGNQRIKYWGIYTFGSLSLNHWWTLIWFGIINNKWKVTEFKIIPSIQIFKSVYSKDGPHHEMWYRWLQKNIQEMAQFFRSSSITHRRKAISLRNRRMQQVVYSKIKFKETSRITFQTQEAKMRKMW